MYVFGILLKSVRENEYTPYTVFTQLRAIEDETRLPRFLSVDMTELYGLPVALSSRPTNFNELIKT